MKFTLFGGATGILEHAGRRMLFDPWLDDGIFHGAWYHFPPLAVGVEDLGRIDYVYISHIHEDHCSPGTLRHVSPDAEVILMDRRPNMVERFLERHRLRFRAIHRVPPRTPVQLADDLVVDTLTADPAHALNWLVDSALIVAWDGVVVYNANDCPPYEDGIRYLRERYPRVDLALLPYAPGSSYPACFTNLADEEKLAEGARILETTLGRFVDTVRALDPVRAAPFADAYVIGGSRAHLNRFVPHPPGTAVVRERLVCEGLAEKGLFLNSGQSVDLATWEITPDEPFHRYTDAERDHYVERHLADRVYDHERIALDPAVSLSRLLGHARARLWGEQQRCGHFPAFAYYLDVPDRAERFRVRLDAPAVERVPWTAPLAPPYLRVVAPSTLLALLLIGHVSWNIADAALFLDYERVPNVYEPRLHAWLNFLKV